MPHSFKIDEVTVTERPGSNGGARSLTLHPLTDAQEAEVLSFLETRDIDAIYMSGLIRDNGLESPFNRGTFYACRNAGGGLEGVALIGHNTLIEAHTDTALKMFAQQAQQQTDAHMIMGDEQKVERFWNYYRRGGQAPRLICRELCFEQRWPVEARAPIEGLRLATLDDLALLLPVQAMMAYEESAVNPLSVDPEGFRLRLARRVENNRVWVWVEGERLIFKADIMVDSPEIIYLEGIYVDPQERGRGYGLRCMSQLGRHLLTRTKALCLLVNEQNKDAQSFFFKAGYSLRGCYDTIFLRQIAGEWER